MVSSLRYSAAKTSIIKKPKGSSIIKKLIPTQSQYRKNGKPNPKNKSSAIKEPTLQKNDQPLEIVSYDVELDYQLSSKESILIAIDTILNNQWTESSKLQTRFHSPEMINSHTVEELLFSMRGLSMEVKAEIIKYRQQIPTGLVTVNQLYSIYEKEGHTFVDRALEVLTRESKLKKFIISNASPIISHSPQKFQLGKVTYGYENVELVVKFEDYLSIIDDKISKLEKSEKAILQYFKNFIIANPTALFINERQMAKDSLNKLVTWGFVTLSANHLNEIETHQYEISYPNCGCFLKLINTCRVWLVKLFAKSKFKECLEAQIFDKWEGRNGDKVKMTNFRKPYYGYDLHWVLADALGAGVVEVFQTPMGRGWRLTGKV